VKKVECGTGNLERYGIAYNFRKRIENGSVQIEDHSHLGMCLRLTAAEFGIPFIPIKSWLGTDILKYSECAKVIENPFKIDEKIVVLKKLQPDIAFIHLQKADKNGNAEIDGCLFHDVELARASKKVVVIAEELVDEDYFRLNPRFTTIPFVYTIKVVHQPFGAHPTAVYGYYREDENHLRKWQMVSRRGGVDLKKYLEEYVYSVDNFDEYLLKISDIENLKADTQLGY
jgi:acyl CoA:acetate/3-ketoacid CoA transferase alpha subunit